MTTATIAPASQLRLALNRTNLIGCARARLERRIGAGQLSAAEVILDCPPDALRCGWPKSAAASCGDHDYFCPIDRPQIARISVQRNA